MATPWKRQRWFAEIESENVASQPGKYSSQRHQEQLARLHRPQSWIEAHLPHSWFKFPESSHRPATILKHAASEIGRENLPQVTSQLGARGRRGNTNGLRDRGGTISSVIHDLDAVTLLSCRAVISGHLGLTWWFSRKLLTAPGHLSPIFAPAT